MTILEINDTHDPSASIKLSIIVPIYNSENYLASCLDSICKQAKKNIELILINDGSTDKSIKICNKYIKKFNFIKLIDLKRNKGVSYSRNVGIRLSLGEFICFVDSDDTLLSGFIINILNHIKIYNDHKLFVIRNFVLKKKTNSINFISSPISIFGSIDCNALSLISVTTKTVNDENIEDKDEYLNIKETTSQVKINNKLNWIDKANNIPKYIATPFPPLNFNQIGKRCPKKAIRQDNWINSGKYCIVITTGM